MSNAQQPAPSASRRRATGALRLLRWVAVVAWAGVIFAASSLPGSQVPGRFGTLAHFVEYAVLGGLLYFALLPGSSRTRAAVLAVIIASAYGVTDELHQHFTPGRVPDVADWLMDTAGAATGTAVAAWAQRAISTRRSPRRHADRSPTDAP